MALGDSYTSGPGIPDQVPGSYLGFRSDHNYPSLVAQSLKPASFTDVSCAGATTGSMTGLQGLAAPQFNALGVQDRLVTVGIGGNDVGFALVAIICLALAPLDPGGAPCRAYYTSGGTDRIAAAIAQTAPKIAAVLQGIHQRAPRARVLLIGYPDILPASASDCAPGVNDPLAAGDIPWINGEEKALNRMLARQAAANGATSLIPTGPASATTPARCPATAGSRASSTCRTPLPSIPMRSACATTHARSSPC